MRKAITTRGAIGGQNLGVWALAMALASSACQDDPPPPPAATPSASAVDVTPPPAPTVSAAPTPSAVVMPEPRCRPDMVLVRPPEGSGLSAPYCVDRYEAMLVDSASGARVSPYYAPEKGLASYAKRIWTTKRLQVGGPKARAVGLPTLPAFQATTDFEPKALSKKGVTPNGHTSGKRAAMACRHAGKRLCSEAEWTVACRGEKQTKFPYGASYEQGTCNVFRYAHPAATLHDDPSRGHSDPRLNRVVHRGDPLLRKTGATPKCVSKWGDDGIHDMVGNLDEWLDDPDGTFAGGFYSRSTKDGCDWKGGAHPFHYADYSTGVRCCASIER